MFVCVCVCVHLSMCVCWSVLERGIEKRAGMERGLDDNSDNVPVNPMHTYRHTHVCVVIIESLISDIQQEQLLSNPPNF